MKKFIMTFVLLSLMFPTLVMAYNTDPICPQWEQTKTNNQEWTVRGAIHLSIIMWIEGFIEAIRRHPNTPELNNIGEAENLIKWIDSYCQANPNASLVNIGDAAVKILEKNNPTSNREPQLKY